MRIGLDTRTIMQNGGRGIGNYALNLYRKLLQCFPEEQFVFLLWDRSDVAQLLHMDTNVEQYRAEEGADYAMGICRFVEEQNLDVIYIPSVLDMPLSPVRKKWNTNAKLVVTCYDLVFDIYKNKFLQTNKEAETYKEHCATFSESDLVFSNSENTRTDLINYGCKQPIVNISMDGSQPQYTKEETKDSWEKLAVRYGLKEGQYFLAVLAWWYSKNLRNVALAYCHATEKNPNMLPLVICFKMGNIIKEEVAFYLKQHPTLQGKLIFTDYLEDEELEALYWRADWLVHPARYEGFGMPVVEGWRHGLPVMTSNSSSLIEIAHDAAIIVEPESLESIEQGFERIKDISVSERENYIALGRERAKDFSWEKTARRFMDELYQLLKNERKITSRKTNDLWEE